MITIAAVGNLKEDYLKKGVEDYIKRISHYERISCINVAEANPSLPEAKRIASESEQLARASAKADYTILCDRCGKLLSSEEFSKALESCYISAKPNIAFLIGGSNGVDKALSERADLIISFSKLTFPHGLFRLVLTEQIYRAFKIMKNEAYHK